MAQMALFSIDKVSRAVLSGISLAQVAQSTKKSLIHGICARFVPLRARFVPLLAQFEYALYQLIIRVYAGCASCATNNSIFFLKWNSIDLC